MEIIQIKEELIREIAKGNEEVKKKNWRIREKIGKNQPKGWKIGKGWLEKH